MTRNDTEEKALQEENISLRRLLWLHHDCGMVALYGDDWEMQCSVCGVDFKRDSVEDIEINLVRNRTRRFCSL